MQTQKNEQIQIQKALNELQKLKDTETALMNFAAQIQETRERLNVTLNVILAKAQTQQNQTPRIRRMQKIRELIDYGERVKKELTEKITSDYENNPVIQVLAKEGKTTAQISTEELSKELTPRVYELLKAYALQNFMERVETVTDYVNVAMKQLGF